MRNARICLVVGAVLATFAAGAVAADAKPIGPVIVRASLKSGGHPCSTTSARPVVVNEQTNGVQALARDPGWDGTSIDYSFAVWPVDQVDAVTTIEATGYSADSVATAFVPDSVLSTGRSYAWRVQATDNNGASPSSQVCYFAYDDTPPSSPGVTSANYPPDTPGPIGQLARFTFDGHGDADIAGFVYTFGEFSIPVCSGVGPFGQLVCPDPLTGPDVVRATKPGGTASVALTPAGPGPATLRVRAVDRAGNWSPETDVRIYTPFSGPSVTVLGSGPICTTRVRVLLQPAPGVTNVVSYRYSMSSGPVRTAPADSHGEARIRVPLPTEGLALLSAESVSANGFVSTSNAALIHPNPQVQISGDVYDDSGAPQGGVGIAGTFTLQPPFDIDNPASYSYSFDGGASATVAADEGSGSATITWTPTSPGSHTLTVSAASADGGAVACSRTYPLVVAG